MKSKPGATNKWRPKVHTCTTTLKYTVVARSRTSVPLCAQIYIYNNDMLQFDIACIIGQCVLSLNSWGELQIEGQSEYNLVLLTGWLQGIHDQYNLEKYLRTPPTQFKKSLHYVSSDSFKKWRTLTVCKRLGIWQWLSPQE